VKERTKTLRNKGFFSELESWPRRTKANEKPPSSFPVQILLAAVGLFAGCIPVACALRQFAKIPNDLRFDGVLLSVIISCFVLYEVVYHIKS
jgi:hypothetical protein